MPPAKYTLKRARTAGKESVAARAEKPEKQFRGGSRLFWGFEVLSNSEDYRPFSGGASSDEDVSGDSSESTSEYSPSDRCGSELDFDFPSDEFSSGDESEPVRTDESDQCHSRRPTPPTRNGHGAAGSSRCAAAGSDGERYLEFVDGLHRDI